MTDRRKFLFSAAGVACSGFIAASAACASPLKKGSSATGSDRDSEPCQTGGALLNTEVFEMQSGSSGVHYRIKVAWPVVGDSHARFPVVFLLDANDYFDLFVAMSRSLAFAGECPQLIIVGIGYPVDSLAETIRPRLRDFTWVADAQHGALVAVLTNTDEPIEMAGGEEFLRFINEDLKTYVGQNYAADVGNSALFGHSLGGLFALSTLFSQPASFERYSISSPPLLWANEHIFREETEYASKHDDLPVQLLLGAGSLETSLAHVLGFGEEMAQFERDFIAEMGAPDPLSQLGQFHAQLSRRAFPNLHMSYQIFEGESHASVAAVAFVRGLRTLFVDVANPSDHERTISGRTKSIGSND